MNDIKCPKCGETFKVDQAGYADIVKQVHDREFAQALQEKVDQELAIQKIVGGKSKNRSDIYI